MYTTSTNLGIHTIDLVGSGRYIVITAGSHPDKYNVHHATSDDGNAMRLGSGSLNLSWADALDCAERMRSDLAKSLRYWQTHRPSWVA